MGRRKKQEEYVQEEYEYEEEENSFFDDMKKEIIGIVLIALAVLLGIGLLCGSDSGTLLEYIAQGLHYLFGKLAILFPIFMIMYSLFVLKDEEKNFEIKWFIIGLFLMTILGSWISLANIDNEEIATQFGGVFAMLFSKGLYKIGGMLGGYILLFAISALTFILLTRRSFIGLLKKGARSAKEGVLLTKESLGGRFNSEYDDEDEEGYIFENELPEHTSQMSQEQKSNKNKNFNFVISKDDDDESDDEEVDEEVDEDDDDTEYYIDDEENEYSDDEEYDEEDVEIIDTNVDGDEENEKEIKPLAHENFFQKLFKKNNKKEKNKKFDEHVVELIGMNENPEDVKKAFEENNEGIVDLGFWEENSNQNQNQNENYSEDDDSEEYDEDETEEEYDEEEYDDLEDEDDDEEYDEESDEDAEEYDEESDDEDDDDREIEIGLPSKTKITKEVDALANTPKMKPIATTDEYDDTKEYEQKIKVNDPHRKKKEIKLIDEEGEEETVVVDEEEPIIPYTYPKMTFLSKPPVKKVGNSKQELKEKSIKLGEILESFKVKAKVIGVTKGPAVTRFELELAPGVKVSAIQNLSDDIAMHMASSGVRIAAVPGKAAIGIELANSEPSSVYEREVLDSDEFKNAKSKLSVPLGKGIDGKIVSMDIAKMPHILIAGATGSGKSVCINTIVTSIIYKAAPDEVKLIMVDPKVVELKMYADIPHLLIPVVTEPKKAASALNWAVAEMLDRYRLFAENNVKNLQGYNELMEKEGKRKVPQIVIIIDELADLMMAAGKEVEDAICRLAQMARAAGMHLIIATQRPSVDVITGLIKANIPSRIAFAVSSAIDSRTILDCTGAEKLLGRGDMLYFPVGANKPLRVQGAYVDESEIEKIVDFIKGNQKAVYRNDVLQKIEKDAEEKEAKGKDVPQKEEENDGEDPLLYDALELMNEIKKASITMFQRRFKIGYNRAANLMDLLEEKGFVGPDEGTKPRKVYFDAVRDALSMLD